MEMKDGKPCCILTLDASVDHDAWLAVSLRPFNPEGVSEIEHIGILEKEMAWEINKKQRLYFSERPDGQYLSNYRAGDVYQKINRMRADLKIQPGPLEMECKAAMATAAAVFQISKGRRRTVEIQIPLQTAAKQSSQTPANGGFVPNVSTEARDEWQR